MEGTGRFYIEEGGKIMAEMDYRQPEQKVILVIHTGVDESLSGKRIGKNLVTAVVEYAREKRIVSNGNMPLCKESAGQDTGSCGCISR